MPIVHRTTCLRTFAVLHLLLWALTIAGAESWEIAADLLEVERQQAHAQGEVRVDYGDISMTANELKADLASRILDAEGNVRFSQGDRLLSGSQLHYELDAREGWLTAARGRAGPLLFAGDRIEMHDRTVTATSGTFTTCDLPHPHYRISAREITIVDGRRAILQGAQLWYGNKRLLRLPRLSQPVPGRGVEAQGLVPRSGYASGDGFFAGIRYLWTVAGATDASVELRATTGRGIRGIGTAQRQESWGTIALSASTKDDIGRQRISSDDPRTGIRTTLVDVLPELSVLTTRRPVTSWLIGQANFTAGRYFERETRAQESRAAATLFAASPEIPLSKSISVSPGIALRTLAAGADSQTVIVQRLGIQTRTTSPVSLRLSFIRRTPHGKSPFRFDEVEIKRELNASALAQLGRGWRSETTARYDLDRASFRDVGLTLARRVHCLEYSIAWSKTRREFRAQVGLADF